VFFLYNTFVSNGVETLPKISVALVGRANVTDRRQTDDRQTDGRRAMTYRERHNNTRREFTFAKNYKTLF